MKLHPYPLLLAVPVLLFALSGCDTVFDFREPDRIVEGVNFTRLFAPPTPAEQAAVLDAWAGRDVSVQGYRQENVFSVPGGLALRIVSHTVGDVRHYGAVIAPVDAAPGSLPVLAYLHGGDGGVDLSEFLTVLNFGLPDLRRAFVFVIPSFRSESLRFGGARYVSDGPPSPWNYDVDDALALLNVALETTPSADTSRLGVIGFSRGAGVGLVMAVRDPRIDAVVDFFGPTDFFGPFVQDLFAEALRGEFRGLPGETYLNDTFVQPLKRGEIGLATVREALLLRSPVFFADRLPQVQVHHGRQDPVVPVSQAEALIAAMKRLGRTAPAFESYLYEGGNHNPLSLAGSLERTGQFLSRLTAAVPSAL